MGMSTRLKTDVQVPVRFNYVRWIQDLLDTTSPSFNDRYDPDRQVLGLDM